MLKEETMAFLRTVSPFDLLTEEDLESIVEDISLEYYPKGVRILTQGGPPSDYLRIIKKGGVKVFVTSDEEEEILIDYRSEGEQFGFISVMSADRSRANIVAVEDTICYLIPKEKVVSVVQRTPQASEYYLKSFFLNFIDKTRDETRRRFSGRGDGERLLFTVPVGKIVRREPVTASDDMPIREAARLMSRESISSLVVTDPSGVPVGIMTDRDLREKVVARGRDLDDPVRLIMSAPLVKVDAEEYCFEALLRMMHHRIHHILVVEGGTFRGIVTNHDFMMLQGSAPTVLVKEIESVQSLDALGAAVPRLRKTVSSLLREGARAHNITGLVTELTEKLINRAVEIIERERGVPPLGYTLFLLGDGARRELCLSMPISLGVVYEDTNNVNVIRSVEQYFTEFGRDLCAALGGMGVAHAERCLAFEDVRSLQDWKAVLAQWASAPFATSPRMDLFDMRAVRGPEEPVQEIRSHLLALKKETEEFMDYMATRTVENRPPLGFFRKFVVEKGGEHRNELNIYQKGIRPLVDAVRVFCMEKDILELPTIRRLAALRVRYGFEEAESVEHALDYLYTLLIHGQLEQAEQGEEPDTFVNPEGLGGLEKKTLKESFQLTAELYDIIEKSYRTERA
jgi:CBS domain-containing protein